MEPGLFSASPFLPLVGWSAVLLVVHILLQGFAATKELGSRWNAGPRDEGLKPSGRFAGRAERASSSGIHRAGAGARAERRPIRMGHPRGVALVCQSHRLYPALSGGHPYFRSFVWLISLAGLGIMLLALVL